MPQEIGRITPRARRASPYEAPVFSKAALYKGLTSTRSSDDILRSAALALATLNPTQVAYPPPQPPQPPAGLHTCASLPSLPSIGSPLSVVPAVPRASSLERQAPRLREAGVALLAASRTTQVPTLPRTGLGRGGFAAAATAEFNRLVDGGGQAVSRTLPPNGGGRGGRVGGSPRGPASPGHRRAVPPVPPAVPLRPLEQLSPWSPSAAPTPPGARRCGARAGAFGSGALASEAASFPPEDFDALDELQSSMQATQEFHGAEWHFAEETSRTWRSFTGTQTSFCSMQLQDNEYMMTSVRSGFGVFAEEGRDCPGSRGPSAGILAEFTDSSESFDVLGRRSRSVGFSRSMRRSRNLPELREAAEFSESPRPAAAEPSRGPSVDEALAMVPPPLHAEPSSALRRTGSGMAVEQLHRSIQVVARDASFAGATGTLTSSMAWDSMTMPRVSLERTGSLTGHQQSMRITLDIPLELGSFLQASTGCSQPAFAQLSLASPASPPSDAHAAGRGRLGGGLASTAPAAVLAAAAGEVALEEARAAAVPGLPAVALAASEVSCTKLDEATAAELEDRGPAGLALEPGALAGGRSMASVPACEPFAAVAAVALAADGGASTGAADGSEMGAAAQGAAGTTAAASLGLGDECLVPADVQVESELLEAPLAAAEVSVAPASTEALNAASPDLGSFFLPLASDAAVCTFERPLAAQLPTDAAEVPVAAQVPPAAEPSARAEVCQAAELPGELLGRVMEGPAAVEVLVGDELSNATEPPAAVQLPISGASDVREGDALGGLGVLAAAAAGAEPAAVVLAAAEPRAASPPELAEERAWAAAALASLLPSAALLPTSAGRPALPLSPERSPGGFRAPPPPLSAAPSPAARPRPPSDASGFGPVEPAELADQAAAEALTVAAEPPLDAQELEPLPPAELLPAEISELPAAATATTSEVPKGSASAGAATAAPVSDAQPAPAVAVSAEAELPSAVPEEPFALPSETLLPEAAEAPAPVLAVDEDAAAVPTSADAVFLEVVEALALASAGAPPVDVVPAASAVPESEAAPLEAETEDGSALMPAVLTGDAAAAACTCGTDEAAAVAACNCGADEVLPPLPPPAEDPDEVPQGEELASPPPECEESQLSSQECLLVAAESGDGEAAAVPGDEALEPSGGSTAAEQALRGVPSGQEPAAAEMEPFEHFVARTAVGRQPLRIASLGTPRHSVASGVALLGTPLETPLMTPKVTGTGHAYGTPAPPSPTASSPMLGTPMDSGEGWYQGRGKAVRGSTAARDVGAPGPPPTTVAALRRSVEAEKEEAKLPSPPATDQAKEEATLGSPRVPDSGVNSGWASPRVPSPSLPSPGSPTATATDGASAGHEDLLANSLSAAEHQQVLRAALSQRLETLVEAEAEEESQADRGVDVNRSSWGPDDEELNKSGPCDSASAATTAGQKAAAAEAAAEAAADVAADAMAALAQAVQAGGQSNGESAERVILKEVVSVLTSLQARHTWDHFARSRAGGRLQRLYKTLQEDQWKGLWDAERAAMEEEDAEAEELHSTQRGLMNELAKCLDEVDCALEEGSPAVSPGGSPTASHQAVGNFLDIVGSSESSGRYQLTPLWHDCRHVWRRSTRPLRLLFYSGSQSCWFISDQLEEQGFEQTEPTTASFPSSGSVVWQDGVVARPPTPDAGEEQDGGLLASPRMSQSCSPSWPGGLGGRRATSEEPRPPPSPEVGQGTGRDEGEAGFSGMGRSRSMEATASSAGPLPPRRPPAAELASDWRPEERERYVRDLLDADDGDDQDPALRLLLAAVADLPMPSPWAMSRTPQGRVVFLNCASGESGWQHPLEPLLLQLAAACRMALRLPPGHRRSFVDSLKGRWRDEARRSVSSWTKTLNERGQSVYINRQTKETMLEHPADVLLPGYFMLAKMADKLCDDAFLNG